jgi:hypothetical protein
MVASIAMKVNPAIRLPWRSGPERSEGVVFVTATKFTFATYTAAALATPHALRFWASWTRVPGAVGLSVRVQPFTRSAWTLTTWASAGDLANFLRSPAHRGVVRTFQSRLAGTSHSWETTAFELNQSWREAMHALG